MVMVRLVRHPAAMVRPALRLARHPAVMVRPVPHPAVMVRLEPRLAATVRPVVAVTADPPATVLRAVHPAAGLVHPRAPTAADPWRPLVADRCSVVRRAAARANSNRKR